MAEPRYLDFEYEDDDAAPAYLWVQGRRFRLMAFHERYEPTCSYGALGKYIFEPKVTFEFSGYPDNPPSPPPPRKRPSALSLGLRRPK